MFERMQKPEVVSYSFGLIPRVFPLIESLGMRLVQLCGRNSISYKPHLHSVQLSMVCTCMAMYK